MDKKLTAIVAGARDLGESDRSLRLFSAEEGAVTAVMRGVRKPKAKLAFASRPLSLCRYELNEKAGKYTVTGAEQIEDLYALSADPVRFSAACLAVEAVDKAALSLDSAKAFVVVLKTLKALLGGADPVVVSAKFLQKILCMSGFVLPPPRADSYPETPGGMLAEIAYLTLDQLAERTYPARTASRALASTVKKFEQVFESHLTSAPVLLSL